MNSVTENPAFSRKLNVFGLLNAVAVIAVALPVLLGLNQSAPFLAWQIMPFNTGVALLALGLSLIAMVLNDKSLSVLFALILTAIGGASLIEHLAHVDLGIDQLMHVATASNLQDFPGRMSLLSSSISALLGLALLFQFRTSGRLQWLAALAAGSGASMALLSPIGSHFSAQFDVAAAVKMSKASGVGFFLAGGFLVFWILTRLHQSGSERFRVKPILLTCLLTLVHLFGWQSYIKYHESVMRDELQLETERTREVFMERLGQTQMAIGRYASRIALLGVGNKEYLRLDSSNYAVQLPSISRIGITDQNFNVIWSYPEDQHYQVRHYNQTVDPIRRKTFEASRDQSRAIISPFLPLKTGEMGCLVAAPILSASKFKGSAYAALSASRLFSNYIPSEHFALSVFQNGQLIYSKPAKSPTVLGLEFLQELGNPSAQWEVSTAPTKDYVESKSQGLSGWLLFSGEALILLIGLLVEKLSHASQIRRELHARETVAFRRLNNALESGKMSAFGFDFKTQQIWRSGNNDKIFGYSTPVGEWTMEHVLRCLPPGDVESFLEKQKIAFTVPGVHVREVRIHRADDRALRWLRFVSQTTFDDQGQALFSEGVLSDITDEKSTALELTTAHSRLHRILESSGEGIWERNYDTGSITYFDDNCRSLFGFERNDEVTLSEVNDVLSDEVRSKIKAEVENHLLKGTGGFDFDFKVIDRRNRELVKWVRARGRIDIHPDGSRHLVSTLRDVSDEVATRRQLELAVTAAQDAVKAKSTFLANMSHEIRTPLNGLIGMTDLLLESGLNSTQKMYAEIAQQSGASLLALINDVLDFSKIEAGKLELDDSQFNIASVVESQIDILMSKAKGKGISLASYIAPDVPSLALGDPGRLGQVLLNLVGNAIKFTKTGGVIIVVEKKKNDGSEDSLRVCVRDTGIGISESGAAKLFSPFVQADAGISTKFGGTGLGLSISKKIVEAMGGHIGVESSIGSGSTFWFEIPLRSVREFSQNLKVGWEKLIDARTLVIDEDAIIRESLHSYVSGFKMRNDCVSTVGEAAALLNAVAPSDLPYELVIIGRTNCKDHADAMNKLKQLTHAKLPPCIRISEFGSSDDSSIAPDSGYFGVVSKPVKQSPLLNMIVSAFNPHAPNTDVNKASPTSPQVKTVSAPKSFRILVADDVPVNLMLTQKMLSILGYSSVTVANGLEVLEILKQSKFDLILMDCQMPEMDGFEATRKIRQSTDTRIREIPIIALTANAVSGDQQLCINAGMNDYLSKPMKREQLAEKLGQWLTTAAEKTSA